VRVSESCQNNETFRQAEHTLLVHGDVELMQNINWQTISTLTLPSQFMHATSPTLDAGHSAVINSYQLITD